MMPELNLMNEFQQYCRREERAEEFGRTLARILVLTTHYVSLKAFTKQEYVNVCELLDVYQTLLAGTNNNPEYLSRFDAIFHQVANHFQQIVKQLESPS